MSGTSAAAEFFRGLPARLLPVVHSGCNVLSRLISVLPRVRLLLRSSLCPAPSSGALLVQIAGF